MRHHAHSIRSDHTTGGRACLEIASTSKRPDRGKSPDASRAPGSFHDGGEVEKTGVANDDAINLEMRHHAHSIRSDHTNRRPSVSGNRKHVQAPGPIRTVSQANLAAV